MRIFTPLAVLLAYILLGVYLLKKAIVPRIFVEILSEYRKLLHSAENTLFRILLHWTELYPILIYCRNIPYLNFGPGSLLGPGQESAAIAYLNIWRDPHHPRLISSYSYYYLVISSVLQMRLVDWFLQVGRLFDVYELLNDGLSGNSECIFR